MKNKKCTRCKIEKPISEFHKESVYCKLCQKEYSHEYDMLRKTKYDYSNPFYKENKKVCSRCGVEKILFDFTRDYKGTYGLKTICNECRRPYYKNKKEDTYCPAIYNIINKTNGDVLYVGQTTTPELRMNAHFSSYTNSPISKVISSGEIDSNDLIFEIIEYVEDKKLRLERESYWIKEKKPKYNINS